MPSLNPKLHDITQRLIERSTSSRAAYLAKIAKAAKEGPQRAVLSCGNLAHGFAACAKGDKTRLGDNSSINIGIISAYNDMLSAHKPYEDYPARIREEARKHGAVAQMAAGVPAMCDGVTQGRPGMELSLFSRDTIALSAAIGLSHNMFDSTLYLGICDKIVPGLLIAALTFGHLPAIFVPAGPMTTGISNDEKAKTRELYAKGEASKQALLASESRAYHSPGTCTFYGTANSNQALIEAMGLHIPDAAFANPQSKLRTALTCAAVKRASEISALGSDYRPLGRIIDERSIINALVMLLATGGSTNHSIHWIAVARAAGIKLNWEDMDALSRITPLLARVYPNGTADVNHMNAAGGLPFLIAQLCGAGLMHADARTVMGEGLEDYAQRATLEGQKALTWHPARRQSLDDTVLRPAHTPFQNEGGLRLLNGNLGRSVIKTSAIALEHWRIEAPAQVFSDQDSVLEAFNAGELHKSVIVVLRFQGPKANGMPELHKLTPVLSVLQKLGFEVALITDGRMSGASGRIPAAIHLTPEALEGGPVARIKNGDIIRLDIKARTLEVCAQDFDKRKPARLEQTQKGTGRELFALFRQNISPADEGARVVL